MDSRGSCLGERRNRASFHPFCSIISNARIMKEIQLTKGRVALVDDEDYDYLNQWRWHSRYDKGKFYVERMQTIGYKKRVGIKIHRLIMNCPPELQVDHRDGNPLNNQKSNLRICTNTQNQYNRDGFGESPFKGVYFKKTKYKNKVHVAIVAQITIEGKVTHLGYFKTEKEAALAYNKMATLSFGEFARLNIIPDESVF